MELDVIPTSTILLGDRFRKDYGNIDDLMESIKSKGLINPITVQRRDDLGDGKQFLLMAGGRRYTAITKADISEVPVRIYDRELGEYELRAIELEENIQRKDLSWQEETDLVRELDELYRQIHGAKTSTSPDAKGHSLRDTAKLLGRSPGGVSMDIKLARMVEELPELEWSKCRNKHEAMKMLNRVEETLVRREMANRAEEIISSPKTQTARDHQKKQLISSFVVGDFFDQSKLLEPESFNFVEIDPPYGIDLSGVKRRGHGPSVWDYSEDGYNEISSDVYQVFLANLFERCYKLMSQHSWLVCWFAPEPWSEIVYRELCNAGFTTTRQCGLWTKDQGQTMNPNIRLGSAYEPFYWAWKGSPTLGQPGCLNVFHETPIAAKKKTHPTERPLNLMRRIVRTFTFPNSNVLVPFAGSGVTLLAAHQLKCRAIGYDLSQQFKDSFTLRVMEESDEVF